MNNSFENKIVLSGGIVELDKYTEYSEIEVTGDVTLNMINLHENKRLKIKVKKGNSLFINMFDYAVDLKKEFDIELEDDVYFKMNVAFISEIKYDLSIDIKLYGNNINALVQTRGINEEEGTVKVFMNGLVAGETTGNEISEYIKILNKSRLSNVIIPNLIVNTNEVVANHGTVVTSIGEKELFYLLSKGIDRAHASKMIEEGFLLSIMDDEIKKTITNILIGR